jgi:hypothetical protein
MLKSISWQEFLTVIGGIAAIYYTILGLFMYGDRIRSIFSGREETIETVPRQSKQKSHSLIGKIKEEEEITDETDDNLISSADLTVSDQSKQDNLLLGTVADVLKELKNLFQTVIDDKMPKAESLNLIGTLIERYTQLKETKYQHSINLFIHENAVDQFHFELTLEEIQSLWK